MIRVMKRTAYALSICALVLLTLCAPAQKKKTDNLQKPMAGPRATALRITWLYVAPDQSSQKVARVQIGREMVVAEQSGPWMRVYANTDIQLEHEGPDTPLIGSPDSAPPPISGWMEAKGVVVESTPNGDQILMGEAANEEALASDPRGPANAAKSARLLYRRVVEMFPNSPMAPEAAWRAADIQWQIQKADSASRPSARERDPYLREQMDEDEMKKVIKFYPRTREADLQPLRCWTTSSAATGRDKRSARRKSPRSTKNMLPNIRMGRARPKRCTRQRTGRRCWWTCFRLTAMTTNRMRPSSMRVSLPVG